ncbi:hypothetical protein L1887_33225 [Cichorium endivia]|nr:hypothetical protein L1887_33225 [Cichorium endivia]
MFSVTPLSVRKPYPNHLFPSIPCHYTCLRTTYALHALPVSLSLTSRRHRKASHLMLEEGDDIMNPCYVEIETHHHPRHCMRRRSSLPLSYTQPLTTSSAFSIIRTLPPISPQLPPPLSPPEK